MAACHQTAKEPASPLGGTRDSAPVLRGFLKSAQAATAARRSEQTHLSLRRPGRVCCARLLRRGETKVIQPCWLLRRRRGYDLAVYMIGRSVAGIVLRNECGARGEVLNLPLLSRRRPELSLAGLLNS